LAALLATYILQFGNKLILSSFGLHFIWISIGFIEAEERFKIRECLFEATSSFRKYFFYSFIKGISTLVVSFLVGLLVKVSQQNWLLLYLKV